MRTIAKNEQYEIHIDAAKNRAYLTIKGYWRNVDQVPDYLKHWKEAVTNLKSGFTLLTDASQMKTHPADVKNLHNEAQKLIIKAGVKQVAEVQANVIAHAQLDAVANQSKMPKKNFNSREEAEKFLDEVGN